MESIYYILRSIGALILVIWLANLALKYLNNLSNNKMKSIQIVERTSVSKTSSLAIVKIVKDYYLMSFTEQSTETLRKFSEEESKEIEAKLALQEQSNPVHAMKGIDLKQVKEKYNPMFKSK